MQKTSIRFFENIPVRAVWDEKSSKWWFCAMDIAEALTKSKNPRSYWNKIKSRKVELSTICRQLKLKAKDGKAVMVYGRSTNAASGNELVINMGSFTGGNYLVIYAFVDKTHDNKPGWRNTSFIYG